MNEKREKHLIDIIAHLLEEINRLIEKEHGEPYPDGHNAWVDAARKIVVDAAPTKRPLEDWEVQCYARMFEETRDRKPLIEHAQKTEGSCT